jgi:hypothetical protein
LERGELFLADYIDSMKNQMAFAIGMEAWEAVRRRQEYFFNHSFKQLRPTPHFLDKLFLWGLKSLTKVQALVVKFYLFLVLGYYPYWLRSRIKRMSKSWQY